MAGTLKIIYHSNGANKIIWRGIEELNEATLNSLGEYDSANYGEDKSCTLFTMDNTRYENTFINGNNPSYLQLIKSGFKFSGWIVGGTANDLPRVMQQSGNTNKDYPSSKRGATGQEIANLLGITNTNIDQTINLYADWSLQGWSAQWGNWSYSAKEATFSRQLFLSYKNNSDVAQTISECFLYMAVGEKDSYFTNDNGTVIDTKADPYKVKGIYTSNNSNAENILAEAPILIDNKTSSNFLGVEYKRFIFTKPIEVKANSTLQLYFDLDRTVTENTNTIVVIRNYEDETTFGGRAEKANPPVIYPVKIHTRQGFKNAEIYIYVEGAWKLVQPLVYSTDNKWHETTM